MLINVQKDFLIFSGERWRKLRKIVNHSFHTKLLDTFLIIFNQQSRILVKILEDKVSGKVVDIHPYVARCTLDIICGEKNLVLFNHYYF